MKKCGIVCEFNPFHNGHNYIINKAKEMTNSDVVCIMSGNFSQHGTLTIEDKFLRAKNAICAGASMVVELPTIFACSNAENFAFGAIKIAKSLKLDFLAFGVENARLDILQKIAEIKYENSVRFQTAFKNEIENGICYNTALKRAIVSCFEDKNIEEMLNKPNNILAIEYLTQIIKQNAKIKPIAIERCDNGFISSKESNLFLSATAIREKIYKSEDVSKFIPEFSQTKQILTKENDELFKKLAIFKLRELKPNELAKFYDYNEGIEFRIKKACEEFNSFDEIKDFVSTVRYKPNRVNKLLIYPILNITKKTESLAKKTKSVCRCLAVNKNKKVLLNEIDKTKINLIVTNKDYDNLNNNQKKIIEIDLNSSNLYSFVNDKKYLNDKKTGTLFL